MHLHAGEAQEPRSGHQYGTLRESDLDCGFVGETALPFHCGYHARTQADHRLDRPCCGHVGRRRGQVGHEILVRQLRQDDAERVRQLDGQILGADRSATWDQYVERFLRVVDLEAMILPPWGCLVAEADGRLIGFILAEWQTTGYGMPPGAWIVAIAVHPDFRSRGVGRRLVEALVSECKNSGVDQVFSILRADDGRDIRFLERCGFDAASVRVLGRRV